MDRAVLEMLAGHSTLALVACDVEGRITLATPAMERMIGARFEVGSLLEQYVAALPLYDAAGQKDSGRKQTSLARALRGETVMDEVVSLRPSDDGRIVYARCNAAPLRQSDGQIRGAVALVEDVTAEWTATLMQGGLRGRLLDTLNHELRTPLTKILGHAELLSESEQDSALSPRQQSRSVEAIVRASRELAAMAERLTHLADLDTATRVEPTHVDLTAVVRAAVDDQRESAEGKQLTLGLASPPELEAKVDSALIERATCELVTNAIRFAPAGTTVDVELLHLGSHVEISCSDHGPGIATRDRARLVEPFERGDLPDELTSTPGLGLALVSAVTAAHGGTLSLEQNRPHGLVARMRMQRVLN